MVETIENSRTEFKVKLVDDLEESVIAFLNKNSGLLDVMDRTNIGFKVMTKTGIKDIVLESN